MATDLAGVLVQAGYMAAADGAGPWLPGGLEKAFAYTDGEAVEARLLAVVQAATDRSVLSPELRTAMIDWPSRYHLSPLRANLLRPLAPWLAGRDVLEVGAGCGALTRYLGEAGARVVAIEGSVARARVAAARCAGMARGAPIVVADAFQHFVPRPLFDVVTLIGVLEYARLFFPVPPGGGDPVDAMLAHARAFLRPGGVVVIGIENQLGLKYFAGYREDHVAQPMFGIEDGYAEDGVVTFGRAELAARLDGVGLVAKQWLFPFPDYKLPVSVMTERGAGNLDGVDLAPLASASVVADPQLPPHFSFSLERAWRPVFRNGLAGELANSFLAIAGAGPVCVVPEDVLAWHYAVERRACFTKTVCIRVDADGVRVEAARLMPGEPTPPGLALELAPARFRCGTLWHGHLLALLNRRGWQAEDLVPWASRWLAELRAQVSAPGLDSVLPGRWLDAVPRNLVVEGAEAAFFDLEWVPAGGVTLGHLCYRALVLSWLGVGSVAPPADEADLAVTGLFGKVMSGLGFAGAEAHLAQWHAAECEFQALATGSPHWIDYAALAAYRLPRRRD